MNLLKGLDITLPGWAQDILNDPDRSVAAGLASVGYPEKASDEYEALFLENPDEFVRTWLSAYRNRSPSGLRNIDLWDMTRTISTIADPIFDGVVTDISGV